MLFGTVSNSLHKTWGLELDLAMKIILGQKFLEFFKQRVNVT